MLLGGLTKLHGQVTGQGTDITQHLVLQLGVKRGANNIPEKKDLGCQ